MGMLFGKDVGEYTWELPKVPAYNVSNLKDGDIIGVWNKGKNDVENEFLVSKVEDGEIFGSYLPEKLERVEVKYPHANWVYIGKTIKEKL